MKLQLRIKIFFLFLLGWIIDTICLPFDIFQNRCNKYICLVKRNGCCIYPSTCNRTMAGD